MKIRAIVNGVCFYTTTTAIKRRTVSDFSLQNTAMFFALDCMGKDLGIGKTVTLYDEKMNQFKFDIQLTKA
jgi:hypothetical protein